MILSRYQKPVADGYGKRLPGQTFAVKVEYSQAPAVIYADRDGLVALPDGAATTDDKGELSFYAVPGIYRITNQDLNIDWRDVDIGYSAAITHLVSKKRVTESENMIAGHFG